MLTVNPASITVRAVGALIAALLPLAYSASSVAREPSDSPPPSFSRFSLKSADLGLSEPPGTERKGERILRAATGELLVVYRKVVDGEDRGVFLRTSSDGGARFSSEEALDVPEEPGVSGSEFSPVLLRDGLGLQLRGDGNIYFQRRRETGGGWTEAFRVNDELRSVAGSVSLLQGPDGNLYCVWLDGRRGNPLVYFSASADGGRTWSANRPVEYDFREGDQRNPTLVFGAGGRLLVFWEDWRDRRTLVDIRYAYSDDGGRHWLSGGRVNDDEAHVWQIDFGVAAIGSQIFVAFSDFRDPGPEGDNDWNIYFARSDDNGKTFGKNIRLNDVVGGVDKSPKLAVNDRGEVFCAWRTGRDSIFGDVAVSYSPDGGDHWSPSAVLGRAGDFEDVTVTSLVALSDKDLLVRWRAEGNESTADKSAVVTLSGSQVLKTSNPASSVRPQPLEVSEGTAVFSDTFSNSGPGVGWSEQQGVWLNVDGSYMGVGSGASIYFRSFAPVQEPESYVLTGRFRLDPEAHFLANIFFRATPSLTNPRHFVISNRFRSGSWISLKDDDRPPGVHYIGGQVLDQTRHPFLNDRWYRFRLVVTPEQADYFVDGRHLLSAKGIGRLSPNLIGLGGYTTAPTYFDDISVRTIRK